MPESGNRQAERFKRDETLLEQSPHFQDQVSLSPGPLSRFNVWSSASRPGIAFRTCGELVG